MIPSMLKNRSLLSSRNGSIRSIQNNKRYTKIAQITPYDNQRKDKPVKSNKYTTPKTLRDQLYVRDIRLSGNNNQLRVKIEDLPFVPSKSVFQETQYDLSTMHLKEGNQNTIAKDISELHKLHTIQNNDFIQVSESQLEHQIQTSNEDIKGLVEVAVYKFLKKPFQNSAFSFYKCRYFQLYYFPPQHYLKLFFKSSTSMQLHISSSTFANGNTTGTKYKNTVYESEQVNKVGKTIDLTPKQLSFLRLSKGGNIPSQLAFQRINTKKYYKKVLKDHIYTNKSQEEVKSDDNGLSQVGCPKKGLYLFFVSTVPDKHSIDEQDYCEYIKNGLQKIDTLDWYKDILPKVKIANNSIPLNYVNEQLAKTDSIYRLCN